MERSEVIVQFFSLTASAAALLAAGEFDSAMATLIAAQTLVSAAAAYDAHNKHMSRAYFLREDLLLPKDSPYWKVIENGNDIHGVLMR